METDTIVKTVKNNYDLVDYKAKERNSYQANKEKMQKRL